MNLLEARAPDEPEDKDHPFITGPTTHEQLHTHWLNREGYAALFPHEAMLRQLGEETRLEAALASRLKHMTKREKLNERRARQKMKRSGS